MQNIFVSTSCPQGVFSLKTSYFEPRYILLLPTRTEDYISNMKARGIYTDGQIEKAVSRIDLYTKINRERPGFFDSVILCGRDLWCLMNYIKFKLLSHLLRRMCATVLWACSSFGFSQPLNKMQLLMDVIYNVFLHMICFGKFRNEPYNHFKSVFFFFYC